VRLSWSEFVDIHGVAKTKSVPVSHFEDILNDGADFAVWGLGRMILTLWRWVASRP
jgi:glutamine synthetase